MGMGALTTAMQRPRLGALGAGASDWGWLAAQAGERHGVDPALVLSVIAAESGGDPDPPHRPGDGWGLMQVTEPTAAWLEGRPVSPNELRDPAYNVSLGTRYLRYQLDRYGGDVALAVNAYRAGTASTTPRSRSYVASVLDWLASWGAPAPAEASESAIAFEAEPIVVTAAAWTWGGAEAGGDIGSVVRRYGWWLLGGALLLIVLAGRR